MRRSTYRLMVILHLAAGISALAQPKIEVAGGAEFDLGTILEGAQMTRTLAILNAGSAPLHIEQVAPSCGCTRASISKNVLSRNDTGYLSIAFNSEHFSGRIRKSITIVSDDPKQRNLVVSFTAYVTGILKPTPAVLYLSHVPIDSLRSGTVRLQNIGSKTLTVLSVFDTSGLARPSIQRMMILPRDTTLLTVWVRPDREGLFQGEIIVETDYPGQSRARIHYMVEAGGPFPDSSSIEHR